MQCQDLKQPINDLSFEDEQSFDHRINYTWIIDQWSVHEKNRETLFSPKFAADTYDKFKWFLALVFHENDAIDLFLYADVNNGPRIANTQFSISLLNKANKIGYRLQTERKFENGPSMSNALGISYGWENFIFYDADFIKSYVSNDAVRVSLDLKFSIQGDEPISAENTDESTNAITYRFNISATGNMALLVDLLLKNHGCADVILVAGGREYPAHKIILVASSQVFQDTLTNVKPTKPNEPIRIDLGAHSIAVMTEVLRFIYLGKSKPTVETADGILTIANKFKLEDLKNATIDVLSKTINVQNAPKIFQIASKFDQPELKKEVLEHILSSSVSKPDVLCEMCININVQCDKT